MPEPVCGGLNFSPHRARETREVFIYNVVGLQNDKRVEVSFQFTIIGGYKMVRSSYRVTVVERGSQGSTDVLKFTRDFKSLEELSEWVVKEMLKSKKTIKNEERTRQFVKSERRD